MTANQVVRFAIDPAWVRATVDWEPDAPVSDPRLTEFANWIRELYDHRVRESGEYLVLSGDADLPIASAYRFAQAVSSLVGQLLPQDSALTLVREVMDRGVALGEGATGRYSDSRSGGNLHTDGPHAPTPIPDCFALYCVTQAQHGGSLLLVRLDDMLDRLGSDSETVAVLRGTFHFDRRSGDATANPTVQRPILFRNRGYDAVCYLREYINIGHRHPQVPDLTPEQVAALDAFDKLLDDPELWIQDRLSPGEMAFFNNKRLLHGRTAFEDGEHKRRMLRTWMLDERTAVADR